MATIIRNIIFKPTEIVNYESSNGRHIQSQDYIKFNGNFNGTRRVVSSITISLENLSAYLNTDANPLIPYVPQYPGSPATKKYVDDNIPTKVSDLTNDSNFQTDTQVNQAISAAISSAYKYKGSVANQAALPASGNTTGDVWNTEDTGMNYAWTGSAWDALGTIVDLSGKQDKLIAGSNIQIASDGKTISATDTKYTAGTGISIDANNVISNTQTSAEWGNITGTLSDQTDLQNALNSKADVTDVNTRTFYIASTTDTSGMQRVINYLDIGNNPIVDYGDAKYTLYAIRQEGTNLVFYFYALSNNTGSGAKDNLQQSILIITKSSGGAYSMTTSNFVLNDTFLSKTNTTSYTPSGNYNPATKKYVDDQVSAATAGAVSDTAYGSSWNAVTGIAPSKNAVYDKISTMDTAISGNTTNINTINSKIPSEASASNQLADKDYVGDSINSVTAFYITKNANGDQFATYAELAAATTFYSGGVVRVPTKNDYTIVLSDETHDNATTRYIYNNSWEYQYTVNETALTQAQLNAINSGITAAKVAQYDGYATSKQDVLTAGDNIDISNNVISADVNTKTFDGAWNTTTAQSVYDWIKIAGHYAIVKGSGTNYLTGNVVFPPTTTTTGNISSRPCVVVHSPATTGMLYERQTTMSMTVSSGTVTSVTTSSSDINTAGVVTQRGSSAPSSPVQGSMWYDTTNDQLKVYDGTNWNVTGKEYNAGEGIEIKNLSDYSAMQGPAPDGFHIPLSTEWQGLKTIMDGLSLTTGNGWKTNLHLPFAGMRAASNASISNQGSYGFYWSSYPSNSQFSYDASRFYLSSSTVSVDTHYYRASGYSVRCFKDTYSIPDQTWTVVQGTLGGAGIFRNQTEGLISITSNGTTGYTIQDKNLGATTVYSDGDTLTQANMGNIYQWGNNYGFPSTGSVTTSSTQVDASNYGPGNYYSSSTFITGSDDWSSVSNDNLWGGETGVVTIDNAITNTGVLSVNGQTGNVTIGGIQLAPNTELDIKYHWYGSQASYDSLNQYYTDTANDTAYFTVA